MYNRISTVTKGLQTDRHKLPLRGIASKKKDVSYTHSKDQSLETLAIAAAGFQTSESLRSSPLGDSSYSELDIISNSLSENEAVPASIRSYGSPWFQQ